MAEDPDDQEEEESSVCEDPETLTEIQKELKEAEEHLDSYKKRLIASLASKAETQ